MTDKRASEKNLSEAPVFTAIHERVDQLRRGLDPFFIARVPSGFWCLSDVQHFPGASILFADPVVPHFNSLTEAARAQWAIDLGRIGDALMVEMGAIRINYETWGNLDPALHTHITPRFSSEDPKLRTLPPRQAFDYRKPPEFNPRSPEFISLITRLATRIK